MATGTVPDFVVIHRMVDGIDSFPLLAVPFFILAGNLMNSAGITNRIYNFALALVGWLRGGLGHVNVRGLGDLRRHVGHGDRGCGGPRHDRDQGDDRTTATRRSSPSASPRPRPRSGPIIPPSLPFVIYAMFANVSVGALFLAGHPAGRGDGDPDDAHGRLLRAQEQVGRRHPASSGRACCKALGELRDRARLFPLVIWLLVDATGGLGRTCRRCAGALVVLLRRRPDLPVQRGAADHDAGAADRRHDDRVSSPPPKARSPRASGRSSSASFWFRTLNWKMLIKVSMDTIETTSIVLLHRRGGLDLRLDAHRDAHHRDDRELGAVVHDRPVDVPAARQPADALRRLLPRADRGHHDPRADPAADRAQARHRPGALRAHHGAEPHDRAAAPADGTGALRAGAGGEALGRAHDDGDPAVAGSAAGQPRAGDLHSVDQPVAAAAVAASWRRRHAAGSSAVPSTQSRRRRRDRLPRARGRHEPAQVEGVTVQRAASRRATRWPRARSRRASPVRRYNQIIGFATRAIAPGEHVHVHNLEVRDFARDYAFWRGVPAARQSSTSPRRSRASCGADGRVATRNYIGDPLDA